MPRVIYGEWAECRNRQRGGCISYRNEERCEQCQIPTCHRTYWELGSSVTPMMFHSCASSGSCRERPRVVAGSSSSNAAEGNDPIMDEIDCLDLSRWLVSPEGINEFELFWRSDEENMPDKFTVDMVVAHWSRPVNDISIGFDFSTRGWSSWKLSKQI